MVKSKHRVQPWIKTVFTKKVLYWILALHILPVLIPVAAHIIRPENLSYTKAIIAGYMWDGFLALTVVIGMLIVGDLKFNK